MELVSNLRDSIENTAAVSEEITASSEVQNESLNQISNMTTDFKKMSEQLNEMISYFTLE